MVVGERMRRVLLAMMSAVLAGSACVHVEVETPAQIRVAALDTAGQGREQSPGVVVATAIGDADAMTIEVEAAGLASIAQSRATTEDTAFLWFSITKLFTATAIMQLHERGRLDIDAPVRELLGEEWPLPERGRAVTARDLLSHSSGLGNPPVWAAAWPAGHERPSVEQQLAALFEAHGPRLRYPTGRGEGYSNLGFLALGRMIELADEHGRSYEAYIEDEILAVLGMSRTGFHWAPLLEDGAIGHSRKGSFWTRLATRVANPVVFDEPLPKWITSVPFEVEGSPYGGLIGTAEDLAKFLAAHLGYGAWQGRRILSPASVAQMQTLQRDDRGRPLDYALGWHTQLIDGERYFNHMGKGGGYRPAVRIWPGRGYGIVVLTNRTAYDPRPLTRRVPPLSPPTESGATPPISAVEPAQGPHSSH